MDIFLLNTVNIEREWRHSSILLQFTINQTILHHLPGIIGTYLIEWNEIVRQSDGRRNQISENKCIQITRRNA